MHLSMALLTAGLVVGFLVGLTGMGGGALMTPVLIMFFGITPLAAVSSDLVASLFMRPVGAAVHLRRGTVDRRLVLWLVAGAAPAAFIGALALHALGDGPHLQAEIKMFLGAALLVTIASMAVKSDLARRRRETAMSAHTGSAHAGSAHAGSARTRSDITVKPLVTIAIGVVGGLAVGMTSVGAGSLITGMLLLAYPRLRAGQLVGTDLVQAIPLVGAAALGHAFFGDVHVAVAASLVLGAIPAVYVGARLSAGGNSRWVRPVLAVVLFASALQLLGVGAVVTLAASAGCVGLAATISLLRRRTATSLPLAAELALAEELDSPALTGL